MKPLYLGLAALAAVAGGAYLYATRSAKPEAGTGGGGIVGGTGPVYDDSKAVNFTVTTTGVKNLTVPVGQSVRINQDVAPMWTQFPESDNASVLYEAPGGSCCRFVARSPGVAHVTGAAAGHVGDGSQVVAVPVSGTITVLG